MVCTCIAHIFGESCTAADGISKRTQTERTSRSGRERNSGPEERRPDLQGNEVSSHWTVSRRAIIDRVRHTRRSTTYYFGGTGGGVWKSTDGAMTWTSVFDKEGTSAIGSLAVSLSDPNIVYVGTGEGCIRGNASHGDGIYKTVDGGKTWKNIGLRDSRAIGKLIIDPKNPDRVPGITCTSSPILRTPIRSTSPT